MLAEDNKALARRFIEEAFNKGNAAVIDELVSEDFLWHGFNETRRGRDVIAASVRAIRNGFPDFHVVIDESLAEGDKVVQRQTQSGTHLGEYAGVAATGTPIRTTEISILRIVDGMICEGWINVDELTKLRQIGAVSS
jgi:steroid delta-isomerase-like uncharacterized protein